jgi:hypothetical protein
MTQIASEDYPNKLIYLHIDTTTQGWNPGVMQQEHRALRRVNANDERMFDPMVTTQGNESKGGGKFTPLLTLLRDGVRIIPYDTDHTLSILSEVLVISEGLADVGVIDRSGLVSAVDVDSVYNPTEVIVQGSAVTQQDKDDIIGGVWDKAVSTMGDTSTVGGWLVKKSLTVGKFLGLK